MSATARKHEFAEDPRLNGAVQGVDGVEDAAAPPQRRAHLRVVSQLRPERASRGVFALVLGGMLLLGMVLILVINTSLAQGAFTVSELRAERTTLSQQEQALSEAVAAAAAPEALEQRARSLGMVPSESPVFLDVESGAVLGNPKPAGGSRVSTPRLLTPADATATEAVDNAAVGTDLPVAPGADYDPAAVDAAAAQAAAANAAAVVEEAPAGATPTTKAATKGKAAAGKKKGPVGENQMWQDSTILDLTGAVSTGDAGLVAVPVQ